MRPFFVPLREGLCPHFCSGLEAAAFGKFKKALKRFNHRPIEKGCRLSHTIQRWPPHPRGPPPLREGELRGGRQPKAGQARGC